MTHELEHGDLDHLFSATYEELRRPASTVGESRFFGGFEAAQIAVTFEVSKASILPDSRAAKGWLAHPLRQ